MLGMADSGELGAESRIRSLGLADFGLMLMSRADAPIAFCGLGNPFLQAEATVSTQASRTIERRAVFIHCDVISFVFDC